MEIIYYPDFTDKESNGGPILRFFKELRGTQPKLWSMVQSTLENVKNSSSLKHLERQEWVKSIHAKAPIYEFRIPPKHNRAGVVRLYFAYKKSDSNTIVILSAERKHGKTAADREKVKQAEQRYKEVCI